MSRGVEHHVRRTEHTDVRFNLDQLLQKTTSRWVKAAGSVEGSRDGDPPLSDAPDAPWAATHASTAGNSARHKDAGPEIPTRVPGVMFLHATDQARAQNVEIGNAAASARRQATCQVRGALQQHPAQAGTGKRSLQSFGFPAHRSVVLGHRTGCAAEAIFQTVGGGHVGDAWAGVGEEPTKKPGVFRRIHRAAPLVPETSLEALGLAQDAHSKRSSGATSSRGIREAVRWTSGA